MSIARTPLLPTSACKHPMLLGQLAYATHIQHLQGTTLNFSSEADPIWVTAKTKDGQRTDQLMLQHTVHIAGNSSQPLDNTLFTTHTISLVLPSTTAKQHHIKNPQQGYKELEQQINLKTNCVQTTPNFLESNREYSLGKLLQGLTSLFLTEVEQVFNTKTPFIFAVMLKSIPFHLKCGAMVTDYQNSTQLANALAKPNTPEEVVENTLIDADTLETIATTFHSAIETEAQEHKLIELLGDIYNPHNNCVDYYFLLPKAARTLLESNLFKALHLPR